jgi:CRISPR-associated protein Cas1
MPVQNLADILAALSWQRLSVTLVNHRNAFAGEHPLAILQSLFKHALPPLVADAPPSTPSPFVFHAAPGSDGFGSRVIKGREYAIHLIFPNFSQAEAGDFVLRLQDHLAAPRHNFTLKAVSPPERRDLAILVAERKEKSQAAHENPRDIWLDVAGRLDFDPKSGSYDWRIDAPTFFGLLVARLRLLYQIDISPFAHLWDNIRINSPLWEHVQSSHMAKSAAIPQRMLIRGRQGPIRLRDTPPELLPLLLICQELHIGAPATYGRGYYRISEFFDFFDKKIASPAEIRATLAEIAAKSDLDDDLDKQYFSRAEVIAELAERLANRRWRPDPAHVCAIPKKSGGSRPICALSAEDRLLHRHLHRLLQTPFDRMFEDCAVGFRPKRSLHTAKQMIEEAVAEGCRFVVESDIAAFFDEIDWPLLSEKINGILPPGEPLLRQLLTLIMTTPTEAGGKTIIRARGLLQGSPLSPLLANVYLDAFDEEMLARGWRLIRYADDFVILTKTREEAVAALAEAETILAAEKLSLKAEKTAISAIDLGFSFLGMAFGGGAEQVAPETILKKPLYIRPLYGFIGMDYDSVVVKKGKEILQRLPLCRVREIVVFGQHIVSTRLLERCAQTGVAISFCSPSGAFINVLAPDSRRFHEIEARHAARFYAQNQAEKRAVALQVVAAKLENYRNWIGERFGEVGAAVVATLERATAALNEAESIEALRGHEGMAARTVFALVAGMAAEKEFASEERIPYKKKDELNSLLDFAYFLLTARLNLLCRDRGLNPYLGWLHSDKDYYESLVYDLAEPFRFRMDAMVLKLINQGVIKKEDMCKRADKGARYFLVHEAIGRFVAAFERELLDDGRGEENSLGNLLEAQTHQVMRWLDGEELRLYRR